MKYTVKPMKYIIAYIYIIIKCFGFLLYCILSILWDFSFDYIKEGYNNTFNDFYINRAFDYELFRYNTIKDFINNNKDYSHKGL